MIHRFCVIAMLLLAGTMVGCAATNRAARPVGRPSWSLIFNPTWTGVPVQAVARSDWPSTPAFDGPGEQITYREVIYDRPSAFGSSQDFLYRQFRSVRTGHGRR